MLRHPVVPGGVLTDLLVGTIGRVVGLRGEVEVAVVSDEPTRFAVGSTLLLGDGRRPLTIRTSRRRSDRTIVSFDGIDDRTGAESLRGMTLSIDAGDARALDDGEYWDHDLIGCTVVTIDGTVLGVVTDVLHQASGELLAVGDHLIPLVSDVVREVVVGQRITIEPLPGLLD